MLKVKFGGIRRSDIDHYSISIKLNFLYGSSVKLSHQKGLLKILSRNSSLIDANNLIIKENTPKSLWI